MLLKFGKSENPVAQPVKTVDEQMEEENRAIISVRCENCHTYNAMEIPRQNLEEGDNIQVEFDCQKCESGNSSVVPFKPLQHKRP